MQLPFGKKKQVSHEKNNEFTEQRDIGKPATKKGRTLVILSQLLAAAGILILAVGTGLMQSIVHSRRYNDGLSTVNSYRDAFQSAHYTPYANNHHRQWMYLWWIIAGSIALWFATMLLTIRARRIIQWRPALIGFHIYFLVLITWAIDSFLWFAHNDYAENRLFTDHRVRTVIAGLFCLAIADALAVIGLGLIANKMHLDNRYVNTGIRERVIEREVPVERPSYHHDDVALPPPSRVHDTRSAAPVRVHEGGTYVTNADAHVGRGGPVQVELGNTVAHTGAQELGTRRY